MVEEIVEIVMWNNFPTAYLKVQRSKNWWRFLFNRYSCTSYQKEQTYRFTKLPSLKIGGSEADFSVIDSIGTWLKKIAM